MADGSSNTNVGLSRSLVAGSEYVFDYCCTVCQEDGRYLEAVGYCSDCMDYLCQNCFNNHCRPRPMRHHILLDKDSMPKDTAKAMGKNRNPKDKCTEVCPSHADKFIEYYCPAHDALGCNVCSTMDHRNCPGLTYIPDVAEGICSSEEFKQVTKELDTMADCSRKIIDIAKDNTSLSKTFHSDAMQSLKEFRIEVNDLLDKLEDDIKSQAKRIKSEDLNNLTAATAECDNVLKEIDSTRSRFTSLQNDKKYCSTFVALKKAKTTLLSVKKRFDKAEEYTKIKYYKFQPNVQLTQFLQTKDAIGKITLIESAGRSKTSSGTSTAIALAMTEENSAKAQFQTKTMDPNQKSESIVVPEKTQITPPIKAPVTCTPSVGNISPDITPAMTEGKQEKTRFGTKTLDPDIKKSGDIVVAGKMKISPPIKAPVTCTPSVGNVSPVILPVHAKHVGDINVRSSSDGNTCCITGSAVLADDKLVVTNFLFTNSTVKVVDTKTNKLISYIKLSSRPWDITAITSHQLAVTLPGAHEIVFLTLTKKNQLTKEKKIKVNGDCHGIVYARDMLVVSFVDPGKVEIMTLNGDVQCSISTHTSGRPLFTQSWYIAVSHDQDTLYVSDHDNDTVTSLSLTGQVKAVYKDDQLSGPTGLVTDSEGRVYICGYNSNNIHVISAKCEKIQVILTSKDGIKNPYSVSYCENTNRLFVGQYRCDNIKVYQLS